MGVFWGREQEEEKKREKKKRAELYLLLHDPEVPPTFFFFFLSADIFLRLKVDFFFPGGRGRRAGGGREAG